MTEPEPLQQLDRTYVRFRERKLSFFSGCDYFRMASHPRVVAALRRAAGRYGINVAASRLTTGNHELYRQVEARLSRFFAAPDALLVSTGYLTNLVVAQSLAGNFSHVLIDQRSHPSLYDAAQILTCPVLPFRHCDTEDLEKCVARCSVGSRPILLTDGMFSHDGSVAPLRDYLGILPPDGWVLVDDAHGAGVLGAHGRGTPEHCAVSRRRIIQTVALSKALGVYGGAILGSSRLRRLILQRSGMFIGSTPLPLPLAAAVMESMALLGSEHCPARKRLAANAAYVRTRLRAGGLQVPDHAGPIIALAPANTRQALQLKRALLGAGIYPPFSQYPGGPPTGSFRFVISSEHKPDQLERMVVVVLKVLGKEFGQPGDTG